MSTKYPLRVLLLIALVLVTSGVVVADEPIKDIMNIKPNARIFENATRNDPLVLRSSTEAKEHFEKGGLAKLQQQVDFKKQIVLVFAWRGSGQDRLTYSVAESFPEQIFFSYKPGRTRDLRPHVYVFALRAGVVWRTPNGTPGGENARELDEYIKVEIQGRLNSQVMAIGGETTGVTITANGITWELELGDKRDLRRAAEQFHDKIVNVKGRLSLKKGVEIRQRWILKVISLIDPNASSNSTRHPQDRK